MPKISIIVPVYNVEKYLSQCIDSIISQTFTDFELILINDGSTDESPAICDAYAKRDSRIRVIHQKNQGQSVARNIGVRNASSEWIAFVDSDDIIHPQMLECLYSSAFENNVSISCCSVFEDADLPCNFYNSVFNTSYTIDICENNLVESFKHDKYLTWIACAKLIKKTIIEQIPFTPFRIYEDNAVVLKWLCKSDKIAIVESPLYFYRITPNSTTKSIFSKKSLDRLWALNEIYEFAKIQSFKKLSFVLAQLYLDIACISYNKTQNEIKQKNLTKSIKKDIYRVYNENKANNFETKQKILIYETLHPKLIKIYWFIVAFKARLSKRFKTKSS